MKRRYLFPFIYIVANACTLLIALNFSLIYVLSVPSGFVMQNVTRTIGFPRDPVVFSYFVGVGTILQMYLLGLLWELLVWSVEKLFARRRVAV